MEPLMAFFLLNKMVKKKLSVSYEKYVWTSFIYPVDLNRMTLHNQTRVQKEEGRPKIFGKKSILFFRLRTFDINTDV